MSVDDSQAYRKMDVTRERISHLGSERNTPVIQNWFQPCQCCFCLCYPGEYESISHGQNTLTIMLLQDMHIGRQLHKSISFMPMYLEYRMEWLLGPYGSNATLLEY